MGLAPDLFWSLTLREFDALVARHAIVQRRRYDHPAALICAVLAELQRDPKRRAEPFGPDDFLPDATGENKPPPVSIQERALDGLREMIRQMGGVDALPDRVDLIGPDGNILKVNA